MKKNISKEEKLITKGVILTDDLNKKFYPLILDTPVIFLPVAGIPVIEYTIQWAEMNKMTELFLIFSQHEAQIRNFFDSRKKNSKIQINLIYNEIAKTTGDYLRELSKLNQLDDFILFQGDMISNINLKEIVNDYFRLRAEGSENILVCIYKQIKCDCPLISKEQDFAYIINHEDNQLLQIEDMNETQDFIINKDRIQFDRGSSINFKIHIDLFDSQIYICSSEILKYFDENFDKNSFTNDFIKEILTSEICEEKIFVNLTQQNEFSARLVDPRIYYELNQYVIERYFHPLTLERMSYNQQMNYRCQDFNIYMTQQTIVNSSSLVSSNCVLGQGTQVLDNCQIQQSIIGNNCRIGNNVKIINSIIYDNVQLQNDVTINNAIIGNFCVVGQGTTVSRGCVVSHKSKIKPNVILDEMLKVCSIAYDDEIIENNIDINNKLFEQGTYLFISESLNREKKHKDDHIGFEPTFFSSRLVDSHNIFENSSSEGDKKDNQDEIFLSELNEIIQAILNRPEQIEHYIADLVDRKIEFQKQWVDCIQGFMPFLLHHLIEFKDQDKAEQIKNLMKQVSMLLKRTVHSQLEADEVIKQLSEFCWREKKFVNAMTLFIQLLYKLEIFKSEYILKWNDMLSKQSDEISSHFYKNIKPFIQYLEQQDEEEEGEEEEEEECEEQEDQQN